MPNGPADPAQQQRRPADGDAQRQRDHGAKHERHVQLPAATDLAAWPTLRTAATATVSSATTAIAGGNQESRLAGAIVSNKRISV